MNSEGFEQTEGIIRYIPSSDSLRKLVGLDLNLVMWNQFQKTDEKAVMVFWIAAEEVWKVK